MEEPLFSVIMPTYQRANMIGSAIETLLRQTCRDFECLIVDDGSTDDTGQALAGLTLPEKFRYFKLDHIGNMACRNFGIEQARGRWITYLDSDDFWLPERLEEFRQAIERRPEVGFWFSNAFTYRFGRILERVFDPGGPIPEGKIPGHFAVGAEFLPYITTNIAIPRKVFKEYGLYRKDMVILDNELYARMFDGGVQVGVIRKPLAIRRIHDEQVTHYWLEEFPEALAALEAGLPSKEIFERERRKLVYEFALYLIKALQPKKARRFMREQLGTGAYASRLYWYGLTPVPLLRQLRRLHKFYLLVRHWPVLAPVDFRQAHKFVQALIDKEPSPSKN